MAIGVGIGSNFVGGRAYPTPDSGSGSTPDNALFLGLIPLTLAGVTLTLRPEALFLGLIPLTLAGVTLTLGA